MRKSLFISIIFISSLISAAVAQDARFARTMEPIILRGGDVPEMVGSKIAHVRVFTKHAGKWETVPFQIDQRQTDRKGRIYYIFPPDRDADPSLGDDDELVFMSGDLGEKAQPGEPSLGQKKVIEVTGADPRTGAKAYTYIMTFDNPPPLSPKRYARWNAETRSVEAVGYTVGYPADDALFFDSLSVPADRGGSGKNFVDTFKMRAAARIIVQLFDYNISNADYRNTLTGVIDGPVRVIRQVQSELNSVIFRVHKDTVEIVYYPEWFRMAVPVKMGVQGATTVFQADVRLSMDLNESAIGMNFYNQRNPGGIPINGTLGEAEKKLNYGPYQWYAIAGSPGRVVVRMDQSPQSEARQDLYYFDDKSKLDPPERVPGHIGDAGFTVLSINHVPSKARVFTLDFFFPQDWDPKSTPEAMMALSDSPLAVRVGAKSVEAPPAPLPIAEETPWKQEEPRPSYAPPSLEARTRGYLPQVLIDPNLGYGSGFQVVERKTFGTPLSSDFLFLISHRLYQFYRLEEILKNVGGIDEMRFYIEYLDHPNRFFYGIGDEQIPKDLTVFKQERFQVYFRLEKYFARYFMVALQCGAMHNSIGHGRLFTKDEPSIEEKFGAPEQIVGERFGPEVFGMQGGWTNHARVDLAIDTRDDKIYTRRGIFDILEMEYVPKWLGSDYEYLRYRLDLRFYFGGDILNPEKTEPKNLWARLFFGSQTERVLAFRFVAQRMESKKIDFAGRQILDIPFFSQSYFGDANSSRGHYWSQWIDNDLTFAMVELRWHLFKILDGTLFCDVGRVWDNLYDGDEWRRSAARDIHSSYGLGMRFNMVPALMMRIDYGFSKENPSGLLYVWGWHTF